MKRKILSLVLTTTIILASFVATAQTPVGTSAEFLLKENMVLHYKINNSMDFKVKLLELGDQVRYVWYRGDTRGFEVILTADAMDNSAIQLNYIYGMVGMPAQTYSHATSVFFSRELYNDLKLFETPTIFPHRNVDYPVIIEVSEESLSMVVDDLTSGGSVEIPYMEVLGDEGEVFLILKNSRFPLVLSQELDFTITLVAVEY